MNLVKYGLAHFWEVNYLTDLLSIHIIEVMPLKLRFLLNLACYFIQMHHLGKLPQRSHGSPQTLLNHLAHVEHDLA